EGRVTPTAAAVLSGVEEAPDLLADLARDGLLVTVYKDDHEAGGAYWRYHPLLVELLRRRTAPSGPDRDAVATASLRAARYYDETGDAAATVRYAARSGDEDLCARILLEHGPTLLADGRADLLLEGFGALTDAAREAHQELVGLEALLKWSTGDLSG